MQKLSIHQNAYLDYQKFYLQVAFTSHREKRMVYCTKCGTQNPDTAVNCSNCGTPILGVNPQDWHYTRHQNRHYEREGNRRNSGVGLLIAGLFVLALGLTLLYGDWALFWKYFWPVVLVILGIWLLIRGLMWSQRRYR
jgi:ribosomal protein L40E